MKYFVYGFIAALAILHHDWWWWNDPYLVFGFLPIGLAYHALFSVAAGCAWALAIVYAWPHHLEEFADRKDEESASS